MHNSIGNLHTQKRAAMNENNKENLFFSLQVRYYSRHNRLEDGQNNYKIDAH